MSGVGLPYRIGGDGRTATADGDRHVLDLIAQVLFTAPGERVNRPSFGSGLRQLVFAPASDQLAIATQFLVQGALQQWLGEVIVAQEVTVTAGESTLTVTVQYTVRRTAERRTATFTQQV